MFDEPFYLVASFVAGLALGAIYFGGLWLVVQRLHLARYPGLLILGSMACRIGILLAALYWISAGGLGALIACVLGFLALRLGATRLARAGLDRPSIL